MAPTSCVRGFGPRVQIIGRTSPPRAERVRPILVETRDVYLKIGARERRSRASVKFVRAADDLQFDYATYEEVCVINDAGILVQKICVDQRAALGSPVLSTSQWSRV